MILKILISEILNTKYYIQNTILARPEYLKLIFWMFRTSFYNKLKSKNEK